MSELAVNLENVTVHFPVKRGLVFDRTVGHVQAVSEVSLAVTPGEILGLVGESGCGKSTLARAMLGLIPEATGRVVLFGREVNPGHRATTEERRHAQLIFQDPYASLNPRMTVFDAIAEPLRTHAIVPAAETEQEVARLMDRVGLAARLMRKYPHEFSGGQRQRIAIARALALRPNLIVADEPVSALDVSIQAQIINLLSELCRENDLTMVFISHDLSVVRHIADRVAVMYLGRIVEYGESRELFDAPLHPYTQALVAAIPAVGSTLESETLVTGEPPSPMNPPSGCAYHPRCPLATPQCAADRPALEEKRHQRLAACWEVLIKP